MDLSRSTQVLGLSKIIQALFLAVLLKSSCQNLAARESQDKPYIWQPLGPMLTVKLIVGPTFVKSQETHSKERFATGIAGDHLRFDVPSNSNYGFDR